MRSDESAIAVTSSGRRWFGCGHPHHALPPFDLVDAVGIGPVELSHGGSAVPVAWLGRADTEEGEDGLGGEMASCRQLGELPNLVAAKACVVSMSPTSRPSTITSV